MYSVLTFKEMGDDKGALVALEGSNQIPFDIKRVFYIYNTDKGIIRGSHANSKSKFVLIAIAGECKVKVRTEKGDEVIALNTPAIGLYLDAYVWKEMYDFSPGAVLLALSSELYDKNEYINDYDELLRIRAEKGL